MGVGVVLLVAVVGGALLVGVRFYSRAAKPFRFHYFKVSFPFPAHFLPVGSAAIADGLTPI